MQHEMAELPRLAEAGGVFFLSLSPDDRAGIAYTIERLINMLDAMEAGQEDLEPSLAGFDGGPTDDREGDLDQDEWDGDPDDEDGADGERTLGWELGDSPYDQSRIWQGAFGLDEVEEENEHGGDINDERQGDDEIDDDRSGLGGIAEHPDDDTGAGWSGGEYAHYLEFDGNGYRQANNLLREHGLRGVHVSPGLY